ncbi:hypothetical protein RR48_12044 [Papilio machaon]|uniref:Uncharacterized protein n=1 Tax=Papilio machaon TaxID=76193 RepID=A0A194RQ95_PAPMA|nr:hypothetical protein RR48_12044 [Papilio machaon]
MMVKIGRRTFRFCKPVYYKLFKAERINAIRKQYDSFIEEDKKRKERNEYILERLDKIRTTSAIVQVRNTPKDYFTTVNKNQLVNDRKDYMSKIVPMYIKPQYGCKPVNNSTSIKEQEILKEISKKYILIPRLTNILEYNDNYVLKSNIDDNGDWRKKYSILEELKQNEKEDKQKTNLDLCKEFTTINMNEGELTYNTIEEPNVQTQLLLSKYNKNPSKELQDDNLGMFAHFNEVNDSTEINRLQKPEIEKKFTENSENSKDLKNAILNSDTGNLTRNNDSEKRSMTSVPTPPVSSKQDENVDVIEELSNERDVVETDLNTNDLTQKEKMQTEYEKNLKPKEEDIQLEKVQFSNINTESLNLKDASQPENYQQDKGKNEEDNIKSNIDSDIQRDNNISNDLNSQEKLRSTGVDELLVENINSSVPNTDQEEANIKNQIVENQIESHEEQEAPTIAYINPAEQDIENIGHDAQIDEFEAEQIEMFHSDPNVTDYAYDQTGSVVNDDYANTGGYTQDETQAYYEGTQQQVYSEEINDHEETTENYDPHYETQYANYEHQNQVIDEQYDHYEAEEDITQPQLYEQVQFEVPDQNIIQEVERELDAEQNYNNIEPPNPDDNITNIIDEAILPDGEPVGENPSPTPVS